MPRPTSNVLVGLGVGQREAERQGDAVAEEADAAAHRRGSATPWRPPADGRRATRRSALRDVDGRAGVVGSIAGSSVGDPDAASCSMPAEHLLGVRALAPARRA